MVRPRNLRNLQTVTASTGTTRYFFDAVGNRDSVVNANGTSAGYHYDNLNRLVNVTNHGPSVVLSSYTYTLNNAGIRTAVTEADGSRVDYGYDADYKLTSENRTGAHPYTISYVYDNVGNRLSQTKDGQSISYVYNNRDQLTSETGPTGLTTYTYDHAGRMATKTDASGTVTYSWLDNDRMASVSGPGVLATYDYDAAGQRVSESTGGGTKKYLIDYQLPYGQVIAETDGSGNPLASYVYGLDRISMTRGASTHTYSTDGQGSIRQLTNAAGTVSDEYFYTGFGEELAKTGTTVNDFRYVGEQWNANVGWYYNRARWMDPSTGRFTSADPYDGCIECALSQHKYLYANVSPILKKDPTGRFTFGEVMGAIAVNNILATNARPTIRMGGCNPISFTITFIRWDGGFTNGYGSLNLLVGFNLVITGHRSNCIIDQEIRGESKSGGVPLQNYQNWTPDHDSSGLPWWDGTDWHLGYGKWFTPNHAAFLDHPGIENANPFAFPLYKGGIGGSGFFEYRTFVKERSSGIVKRSLRWGILINYSSENNGFHYFEF